MSIELTTEVTVHEVTEEQATRPGWRIEGPFYLEDSEGTVRAEGICCKLHADVMADALNKTLPRPLAVENA